MDIPNANYRMLHVQPQLACTHYTGCGIPTDIVLTERDGAIWRANPVCATHGYAARRHYGSLAELASIERFVAAEKHIPADQVRVLTCCDPQAIPDWNPDPEDEFETLAWRIVYQTSSGNYCEMYVLWSNDFLKFTLHDAAVMAV